MIVPVTLLISTMLLLLLVVAAVLLVVAMLLVTTGTIVVLAVGMAAPTLWRRVAMRWHIPPTIPCFLTPVLLDSLTPLLKLISVMRFVALLLSV